MSKKLLPILLIVLIGGCGEFKEVDIITKEDLERQALLSSSSSFFNEASSSSLAEGSSSSGEEQSSSSVEVSSSSNELSSSSAILCGANPYNPETQFCYAGDNKAYDFCGSAMLEYDPSFQACQSGVVRTECGSGYYNAATHFCQGITILPLCGGETYAATQFCASQDGKVYDMCGGSIYNPLQSGCCNNVQYSHATQFCHGNDIEGRCGGDGDVYVPVTEQCCGKRKYAVATHFCYQSSKIGLQCGNRTDIYDPDLYECKPSINANGIYLKEEYQPVDADGRKYEAVLIGDQTWMAENLNYDVSGSVCYDDDTDNCDIYGRLYDWATAMDLTGYSDADYCNTNYCSTQAKHQGLCPEGWHFPSDDEWDVMTAAAGGTGTGGRTDAGTILKATSGWNTGYGYIESTDKYGFSALPGSCCSSNGCSNNDVGVNGYWWSATQYDESAFAALSRRMGYYSSDVIMNVNGKNEMLSVRCVRD